MSTTQGKFRSAPSAGNDAAWHVPPRWMRWGAVALAAITLGLACDDHARSESRDVPGGDDRADGATDLHGDSAQPDTPASDADLAGVDSSATDASRPDDNTDHDGGGSVAQGCLLRFFHVGAAAPVYECPIEATTMRGCDAVAQCVCAHHVATHPSDEPVDVAGCATALVTPRGAISLADFCPISGSTAEAPTVAEIVGRVTETTDGAWLMEGDLAIEAVGACDEVAAFTLWGAPSDWFVSIGLDAQGWPAGAWWVQDYTLRQPPMLSLDDVSSFTQSTATLTVTAAGAARVAEQLGLAPSPGVPFLVHDGLARLADGVFMSYVMSSSRTGLVLMLEDLQTAGYQTLAFLDGYPGSGPGRLGAAALAPLAAARKLQDVACIATCGCPVGRVCQDGTCVAAPATCRTDADCCAATCTLEGHCEPR